MNRALRDMRQRFFNKRKFSLYLMYVLVEILLVVFGILIALQVDNWNEDRKERKEELRLLEQLVEDFNTNKLIISTSQREYKRVLGNLDAALRNSGPQASLPSPAVFDSIANLWTPSVELLHTDASADYGLNLDRVSNNQLKLALMSFPATYQQYKELENTLKNLTVEQRKIYQRYIPLIASEPGYDQELFTADSMGFLRDREFQNATVDRLWNTKNATTQLEWLTEHNDTILKMLSAELMQEP